MQRSMIDVIAITMGLVATFKPAAAELTTDRPPQQLSRHQNRALVVVGIAVVSAMFWAATSFLQRQAWFSESTGDTADVGHLSLPYSLLTSLHAQPCVSRKCDLAAMCMTSSCCEFGMDSLTMTVLIVCPWRLT